MDACPLRRCDFLLERHPSDSLSDSGFRRRRRAFPYLGQLARTSCLPWSRPPRRLLPSRANSELAAHTHTTRTTRNTQQRTRSPKTNHTLCARLRLLSPLSLTYLLRSFKFGFTVACRSIKATDRTTATHFSSHSASKLTVICN